MAEHGRTWLNMANRGRSLAEHCLVYIVSGLLLPCERTAVEISAGFLVETNAALIPSPPTGHRNFRDTLRVSNQTSTTLADFT